MASGTALNNFTIQLFSLVPLRVNRHWCLPKREVFHCMSALSSTPFLTCAKTLQLSALTAFDFLQKWASPQESGLLMAAQRIRQLWPNFLRGIFMSQLCSRSAPPKPPPISRLSSSPHTDCQAWWLAPGARYKSYFLTFWSTVYSRSNFLSSLPILTLQRSTARSAHHIGCQSRLFHNWPNPKAFLISYNG